MAQRARIVPTRDNIAARPRTHSASTPAATGPQAWRRLLSFLAEFLDAGR